MTWCKLGVEFFDQLVAEDLPPALDDACQLTHTQALHYCYNAELMDLTFRRSVLRRFATSSLADEAAAALVRTGLWRDHGDRFEIVHHAEIFRQSLGYQIRERDRAKENREKKRTAKSRSDTPSDTPSADQSRDTGDEPSRDVTQDSTRAGTRDSTRAGTRTRPVLQSVSQSFSQTGTNSELPEHDVVDQATGEVLDQYDDQVWLSGSSSPSGTRSCIVCGEPLADVLVASGDTVHLGCAA